MKENQELPSNDKEKSIEINIFGQRYNLVGDHDSEQLLQTAHFVDQKMQQIATTTGLSSPLKVAILTALNIAEDFFKIIKEKEELAKQLDQKGSRLLEILDKELAQ